MYSDSDQIVTVQIVSQHLEMSVNTLNLNLNLSQAAEWLVVTGYLQSAGRPAGGGRCRLHRSDAGAGRVGRSGRGRRTRPRPRGRLLPTAPLLRDAQGAQVGEAELGVVDVAVEPDLDLGLVTLTQLVCGNGWRGSV